MRSVAEILGTENDRDVYEVLTNIEVDERIQVVIQRYSRNSGHFISYPVGSDIDEKKDGIHIELDPAEERFVKKILSISDSYILGTVRIIHKEGSGHNFTMANIIEFGRILIPRIDQYEEENILTVLQESRGCFDQPDLVLENPDYECNATKQAGDESNQSVKEVSTSGKPELPPEPEEENKTFLYYVDTSRAECYHSARHCSGLEKRQGDLRVVEAEVDGELPEQVSDLRKCHIC